MTRTIVDKKVFNNSMSYIRESDCVAMVQIEEYVEAFLPGCAPRKGSALEEREVFESVKLHQSRKITREACDDLIKNF